MKSKLAVAVLFALSGNNFTIAQETGIPSPRPAQPAIEKAIELQKPNREIEPVRIYQSACPAVLSGIVTAKKLPPIVEGQCGERSPLEVTAFGDVKLSQPAVLNCRMVTTLSEWVRDIEGISQSVLNSRLSSLTVSTSYQCRRRNNAETGKISEHGFSNALDISGFKFEKDKAITVEANWSDDPELENPSDESTFLKAARNLACEKFTTVLSPDANASHADHFHFDLGCHGKTCTYKICE